MKPRFGGDPDSAAAQQTLDTLVAFVPNFNQQLWPTFQFLRLEDDVDGLIHDSFTGVAGDFTGLTLATVRALLNNPFR